MSTVTMLQIAVAFLATALFGSTVAQLHSCIQRQNCHLPDCFCPTFRHPDFSDARDIPQMVYFGFDDALTVQVDRFYRQLFTESRKNPNGCPISMSLYVQNQWTSYSLVNAYYKRGMEIGSHSVTHTNVDSRDKLLFEAGKQKDNLTNIGGVPRNQVRGWRSPNLKPAGDSQPEVLKSLGYTYDISLTYTRHRPTDHIPWPYTLDYGYPYTCSVKPCPHPTKSHPGFWEIPVYSLYNPQTNYPCAYVDSCRPAGDKAALEYLWSNFLQVYETNRAPFGLNMHAAWFYFPDYLKATHEFLDRLLALDDVYIVTANQVLDWMKNPVKVSEVHKLPEWGCNGAAPPRLRPGPDNLPAQVTTTTTTTETTPSTTTTTAALTTTATSTPTATTTSTPTATTTSTAATTTTTAPTSSTRAPTATTLGSEPRSGTASSSDLPDRCVQGETCVLPNCQCRSLLPPGQLVTQNTPQIIYLTISSNVNSVYYQRILDLLTSKSNPNNCLISATFFVPTSGNYMPYVQSLRSRGHEISLLGTRPSFPFSLSAKEQLSQDLANFQRLDSGAGPGKVSFAYRKPSYDSEHGDDTLQMLTDHDVTYDSSLLTSRRSFSGDSLPWPYTLDFGWQDCDTVPSRCPSKRYPGLWEVPIVPLVDYMNQFVCAYADACYNRPPTSQDTYNFFIKNLEHNMNSNRAPLGINLRAEWFSHPYYEANLLGLKQFLDYVLQNRNDVFVVSGRKMLDWMKNPTGLDKIGSFEPWKC